MSASNHDPTYSRLSDQRFPSWKQALVIVFSTLVLSLTTCMSVVVLFGERDLSSTGVFLMGLTIAVSTLAPFVVVIWLVVARVRGRSKKRTRPSS